MVLAAAVLRREATLTRWYKDQPTYSGFSWIILSLFLGTVGTLALSEELMHTWQPLLSSPRFQGLSWNHAVLVVFIADIVGLTYLVAGTGGSAASPFQPIYFLIPTLALLLREPSSHVGLYAVLIAVSFSSLLFRHDSAPPEDWQRHRVAYGLVSLLCLTLACLIGLLTRQG
jgi:hypothetical protein